MTGYDSSYGLWRPWVITGLVIVAIVFALQDSFAAMLRLWLEIDNYNHCLLIAPVSAWLIWRQRRVLAAIEPRASLTGLVMVLAVAGVWVLGRAANIAIVEEFAAVGLIPLSIWAIAGTAIVRTIMFPLGYLFFLVPFGGFLIPPLMGFTADMTVAAVRASGVPIYHDGLYFAIPNGSFKIIEACSGIRMLIAGVAVGALFAYLTFRSWRRRTVFIAGVVLLTIVANWIRAYIVVMLAHFRGMGIVADHIWLGYVIFALVIAVMLWTGSRFSDIDRNAEATPQTEPARSHAPGAFGRILAAACVTIVIVLSAPVFAAAILDRAVQTTDLPVVQLPVNPDRWSGPGLLPHDWSPEFHGNTTTLAGRYLGPAAAVDMYIISYWSLTQQSELINETNRIFNPKQWTLIGVTPGSAVSAAGKPLAYIETEIHRADGSGRLVRHWYLVDGRAYRSRVAVKLIELRNALTGRPTSAGVVAVSTRFGEDTRAAARVLDEFMAAAIR